MLLGYMELRHEVEYIGPRNALVTNHFTREVRNCYTYGSGDWSCHKVFEGMRGAEDLHPVLCLLTDGYYAWYRKEPVLAAIWQATLADRALQDIDRHDCEYLAGLLGEAMRPFVDDEPKEIEAFSRLAITLIGAAVRYAITLDEPEAQRALAQFKAMLPERRVQQRTS